MTDIKTIPAAMLIDLDSILDTRSGTIAKLGASVFASVIKSGYFSRQMDMFKGVDPDVFTKMYKERDAETLSLSMMTNMLGLVKDFVVKVNKLSSSSPYKNLPRIDINFHPYILPDDVRSNIVKAVGLFIDERCTVEDVDYDMATLTPEFIRLSYDHIVMYGTFSEWLDKQADLGNWDNKACPGVTFFIPMLHRGTVEDLPDNIGEAADELSGFMGPFMNLLSLPVEFFSTVMNPYRIDPIASPQPEGQGDADKVDDLTQSQEAQEEPLSDSDAWNWDDSNGSMSGNRV